MLFEHGYELEKKPEKNEPCIICKTLYTESIAYQSDHFADAFVRENITSWWRYDVRKFTAKRDPVLENGQFNVLAAFSVQIGLEKGKICKNNYNTCLFHCIIT